MKSIWVWIHLHLIAPSMHPSHIQELCVCLVYIELHLDTTNMWWFAGAFVRFLRHIRAVHDTIWTVLFALCVKVANGNMRIHCIIQNILCSLQNWFVPLYVQSSEHHSDTRPEALCTIFLGMLDTFNAYACILVFLFPCLVFNLFCIIENMLMLHCYPGGGNTLSLSCKNGILFYWPSGQHTYELLSRGFDTRYLKLGIFSKWI